MSTSCPADAGAFYQAARQRREMGQFMNRHPVHGSPMIEQKRISLYASTAECALADPTVQSRKRRPVDRFGDLAHLIHRLRWCSKEVRHGIAPPHDMQVGTKPTHP